MGVVRKLTRLMVEICRIAARMDGGYRVKNFMRSRSVYFARRLMDMFRWIVEIEFAHALRQDFRLEPIQMFIGGY